MDVLTSPLFRTTHKHLMKLLLLCPATYLHQVPWYLKGEGNTRKLALYSKMLSKIMFSLPNLNIYIALENGVNIASLFWLTDKQYLVHK